jgi:hypothetical protein
MTRLPNSVKLGRGQLNCEGPHLKEGPRFAPSFGCGPPKFNGPPPNLTEGPFGAPTFWLWHTEMQRWGQTVLHLSEVTPESAYF